MSGIWLSEQRSVKLQQYMNVKDGGASPNVA